MGTQDSIDRRALLKEALAALDEMQAKLEASERTRREPIAIVGMSCRFPGGVDSAASLWALLRSGTDAVGEIPRDRWDADAYYDPSPSAPGKTYVREGGFLDSVDRFEPQFFGISPREANSLDPQQRLLLETAWEALEHAGQAPDRLTGTRTGVFVGITTADYGKLIDFSDPANADVYAATGNALNAAAGRIAFTLGLQGPCASVDTACSSSLVAIHLACQSLRTSESTMAIAGGVNVMLAPEPLVLFSKWGMIAKDARCKTFDAGADGFVRSEGCGVLVLKRLSDAVANRDHVLAVIAGSAVNQDGRSSGLTVPNGVAQQAVLRAALASAGLTPGQIDYVEAHGTGTQLGDPIEIEALAAAMGPGHTADAPLKVGSIKTNIGHAEAASGVAGVMKVVLALQHEEIPPHLHLNQLNPRIAWDRMPLSVPVTAAPWPRGKRPRFAGVSSFGFSGTNAHVIVGEAPAVAGTSSAFERPMHVLTLSARTEAARRSLAARYAERLSGEGSLADVCFTANTGRAHLSRRAAVVAATPAEARDALRAIGADSTVPGAVRGTLVGSDAPKIAFLFTGQGSQYAGMARSLFETQPTFRRALERCDELFRGTLAVPLIDLLYGCGDPARLDETANTQPALFAIEYALAELWRSWGVEPQAVLGHSIGEFPAACIAGVLTLEEAARLVATRGRLMQSLPGGGSMAAVFAEEARVAAAVAPFADRLSLAAVNGPSSVVISGAADAVDAVRKALGAEGIRSESLRVSHAFHSPLMNPILDEFEIAARGVRHAPPRIGLVSNLTGAFVKPGQIDAQYWRRHVASPVRFGASMQGLYDQGYRVFVEIGPMPTLATMAKRFLSGEDVRWLASLRQGRSDWSQLLESLSVLYVGGVGVDWEGFDGDYSRRRVALPTYPFERERCWVVPAERRGLRPVVGTPRAHPLLDAHAVLADERTHVWETEISTELLPYLADHCVQGLPVLPATAYAEMAVAAGAEVFGAAGGLRLKSIEYKRPLFLPPGTRASVQVLLELGSPEEATVRIFSRDTTRAGAPEPWTLHMSGTVVAGASAADAPDLHAARRRCTEEMTGAEFYALMAAKGNQWGPSFQGVRRLTRGEGEAVSELELPASIEPRSFERYLFHPAVADASGHVLVAAAPLQGDGSKIGAFVGGGIDEVRFHRPARGSRFVNYARIRPETSRGGHVLVGDVAVFDEAGQLVAETIGARLVYLEEEHVRSTDFTPDWLYEAQWRKAPRAVEAEPNQTTISEPWLILADRGGLGDAVAASLAKNGGRAILVRPGAAFREVDPDTYEARPGSAADFEAIVSAVAHGHAKACACVLHLWHLDHGVPSTAHDIDAGVDAGCGTTAAVVKALVRETWITMPRLWTVTRGAVPVDSSRPANPIQATAWGFGRALSLEHANLWGGLVDIEDTPILDAAESLVRELLEPDRERELAFAGGERYVARVRRAQPKPRAHAVSWTPDATYLISGGMGGLGLAVARWMVKQGARHLLLIGRTPLPSRSEWHRRRSGNNDARIEAILELESMGASVHPVTLDIADEASVRTLLARWEEEARPPIRGVVHAAGVAQYQPVVETDLESLRALVRPKAWGAWVLHEALGDRPLDFFVSFSSASTLLSSPLAAGYAAANSYLDAFAWMRRAMGRPALSVDWGLWSDVGMVARFQADTSRQHGQARTLTPAAGLEALHVLLNSDAVNTAVIPIAPGEWTAALPGLSALPLLSELDPAAHTSTTPIADSARWTRSRFQGISEDERPAVVRLYLLDTVAAVLGLRLEQMDENQPITAMGLDSLMAVEIKNRIEMDTGVSVPIVELLQGQTVEGLIRTVSTGMPLAGAVASAAAQAVEEGEI